MATQGKSKALCPLCIANGRFSNLSLRQINAKEAIFVCGNSECSYPIGEEVKTVQRIIPELLNEAERKSLNHQVPKGLLKL